MPLFARFESLSFRQSGRFCVGTKWREDLTSEKTQVMGRKLVKIMCELETILAMIAMGIFITIDVLVSLLLLVIIILVLALTLRIILPCLQASSSSHVISLVRLEE